MRQNLTQMNLEIKKIWESKKTNDNMKSIIEKYKFSKNCVLLLPKGNLVADKEKKI